MPEILIYVSIKGDRLSMPTREVLGMARKISEKTGDQVAAALVGANVSTFTKDLTACGADVVYVFEKESLRGFHANIYLRALQDIVDAAKPRIILFPAEATGLDMAPRLAYRLGAGLVTDCIAFEVRNETLIFTKPVYGGKALARLRVTTPVAVVTVRPRTQNPFPEDSTRTGRTVIVGADFEPGIPETTVVERIEEEQGEEINLEDARIVVSGGRGLGDPGAFDQLKKLAKILDGAVGASRVPIDQGWVPPSYQVGLTGKIVSPDVYFAIGISGASQHIAGMSDSKFVVAINIDPDAPIFNMANVGVVDDFRNVLPTLIDELGKSLSE